MATKKKAEETPQQTETAKALNDVTGMAALEGKNIDQRMADLLKDHKKMGAR
jgi:hypothetical protein